MKAIFRINLCFKKVVLICKLVLRVGSFQLAYKSFGFKEKADRYKMEATSAIVASSIHLKLRGLFAKVNTPVDKELFCLETLLLVGFLEMEGRI